MTNLMPLVLVKACAPLKRMCIFSNLGSVDDSTATLESRLEQFEIQPADSHKPAGVFGIEL